MTEPKRGTFALKDWLQLLSAMFVVTSAVFGLVAWIFSTWTDWRDVPERLVNVEALLAQIGNGRPQVIAFLGGGIVAQGEVVQGAGITITYVLRRTIDCPTSVHVRFFDHTTNTVASSYSYTTQAVRSPVSPDFAPFAVRVTIPRDLPPGVYSYLPEILPENCGVYTAQVPPMSDPFTVLPME